MLILLSSRPKPRALQRLRGLTGLYQALGFP